MASYQSQLGLGASYLGMHGTSSESSFLRHLEISKAIGSNEATIREYFAAHGSVRKLKIADIAPPALKDLDRILVDETTTAQTGTPVEPHVAPYHGRQRISGVETRFLSRRTRERK